MYLVNAQQMREMDRFAIKEAGIPGIVLMELAGKAVVEEIEKRWPDRQIKVVVLAGHGNNGGDGFVVARHLSNKGYPVITWLIGQESKMSSDASVLYRALIHGRYSAKIYDESKRAELCQDLGEAQLVIDALLGTGAQGALREPIHSIVEYLNQLAKVKIVSVDMPSGVNADTGEVSGEAVRADLTVTFAFPKWGQYLFPGAAQCGEIIVADISIPKWVADELEPPDQLLTPSYMAKLLPRRKRHSHKGTYGHVLIVGGSQAYVGAPCLAALGAVRSGAGLVTIAVPKSVQPMVAGRVMEAIYWPWPDSEGHFSQDSWKELLQPKADYDFTVVGPGIAQHTGSDWLRQIVGHVEGPLLLDADALNLLAKDLSLLQGKKNIILTPHPGEMARLMGITAKEVEQNRPHIARQFAVRYQVYVVLKGTYPIIATPEGKLFVSTRGSSSLAKGGSGDVLSGMIASFVNQTGDLLTGTLLAVYIHGMAGEFMDEYSGAASDLGHWIGEAVHVISLSDA